jgi:hypothetical protein
MDLGNKIKMKMLSEGIERSYEEISQLSGMKIEDVRQKMKTMSFSNYIDVMTALKKQDAETLKEIFGITLEYNMGGTVSPAEMRTQRGQPAGQAGSQGVTDIEPTQTPMQAQQQRVMGMQRLGKKNLGGASAQQAASALDAASNAKPLNPMQRKSLATQAAAVDALAQDPRTATQFRQLLNRLNKGT